MLHTQTDNNQEQQQISKHMDTKSTKQENCSLLKDTNILHTYKIYT